MGTIDRTIQKGPELRTMCDELVAQLTGITTLSVLENRMSEILMEHRGKDDLMPWRIWRYFTNLKLLRSEVRVNEVHFWTLIAERAETNESEKLFESFTDFVQLRDRLLDDLAADSFVPYVLRG